MKTTVADWRKKAGLVYIENQGNDILQEAIKFSAPQLKSVDLEQFDELMLVLSNYYIYLYSEFGILSARVRLLEDAFDIEVTPLATRYGASHAKERRAMAIAKNEKLQKQKAQLDNEQAKLEMLRPVCDTIKNKIYVMTKIYDRRVRNEYRSTRG